ncbi:hypothetical protein, partial [Chelativorans composti]
HRALAHFRGKRVRRLAHDAPSYSGVGASGKPGAVQFSHHSKQNCKSMLTNWSIDLFYSQEENK